MATYQVHAGDDIQSVINNAAPGSTIVFNAGTYNLANSISLRSGLTLQGMPGATLVAGGHNSMMVGQGVSNVTIQGFDFEGGPYGIGVEDSQHAAVMLYSSNGVTVTNNSFHNIYADGLVFSYNSNNLNITNNTANQLYQFASIHDTDGSHSNITIDGNTFSNASRMGIEVIGPINGLHVDKNTISSVGNNMAISIVDYAPPQDSNVTVEGNKISNVGTAVEVADSNMVVANNTITNSSSAFLIGHLPNSYIINNTMNGDNLTYSVDGGFTGQEYVGTNAINGQQVTGWSGHPNDPSIPAPSQSLLASLGGDPPPPSSGSGSTGGNTTQSSGSGPQTLALTVSGDMYQGDPQIVVSVDGQQVGTYDISAHHSLGQTQTIDIAGNFAPSSTHQVQVQFANDAWDGVTGLTDGHDRNVYIESAALNGITIAGQNYASDTGSGGEGSIDPNAAVMIADGVTTYNFPDPPVAGGGGSTQTSSGGSGGGSSSGSGSSGGSGTQTSGSGPDTLALTVSGDMYQGDAQIAVLVDGKQVGTYGITAHHSQGQSQTIDISGNFDPSAAHQVQVQFLNDAWDGTPNTDGHDRNVYVQSVALNGVTVAGQHYVSDNASLGQTSLDPNAAVMLIDGSATYNLPAPSATGSGGTTQTSGSGGSVQTSGNGSELLALTVSGDMYQGDPEIAVLVDGKQVGTYDLTAHHALGQAQTLAVAGNFDPTVAHTVQVQFLNDAWDGMKGLTDGHDRNVYVDAVSLNGSTIWGQNATSNTASGGEGGIDPHAGVMIVDGTATYTVPAEASATAPFFPTTVADAGATPASSHALVASADVSGHNVFTLNSLADAGSTISNFNPATDYLNLMPLLHSISYVGANPALDNHLAAAAVDNGTATAILLDPAGKDPSHGQTLVTLNNVHPGALTAAHVMA